MSGTTSDFCIVLATAGSEETLGRIVERVLEDKLAACVQALPIRSWYIWDGAVRNEPEHLLLIKAKRADYAAIEAAIRLVHDYEIPEIVQLDIEAASQAYGDWIRSVTRAG